MSSFGDVFLWRLLMLKETILEVHYLEVPYREESLSWGYHLEDFQI